MKFCSRCGSQQFDYVITCPNCGNNLGATNNGQPVYQQPYQQPSSASVVLGIVGIISAFLFALVGHITSICGIVKGLKDGNTAGLVLSVIGEVCSVISSVLGVLLMM